MSKIVKNSLCVILSMFFLSACSFNFFYNNLAWLSDWYLDDYVTLNAEQQQVFDSAFTEFHLWHRQTQLKEYRLQLTQFKTQVNRGISHDELNAQVLSIRNHWILMREKAKPQLISLTRTLSAVQRQQVLNQIDSLNRERMEDHEQLTKAQWHKKSCTERQVQFKKWLGKLNPAQKLAICKISQAFSSTFEDRTAYRLKWHAGLQHALSMELSKQSYEAMFTELISNPDALKSEKYVTLSNNNTVAFIKIFHHIMNNLTDKQRKRFNKRLNNIIDDLNVLERGD